MAKPRRTQGASPRSFPSWPRPLPHSSRRTLRASPLLALPGPPRVPWLHQSRPRASSFPARPGFMTTPLHFDVPLFRPFHAAGTSLSQNPLPATKTLRIFRTSRFLLTSPPCSRVRRLRGDPARPLLSRPLPRFSLKRPRTRMFTTSEAFR